MPKPGKFLRHAALTLFLSALLGLAAGAFVIYRGVYDVAAIHQHTPPVYGLLQYALDRSVDVRAEHIPVPDLSGDDRFERGFRLFREHCVQCHGAPGVPRSALGQGMLPLPTNLVETARSEPPEFIYWVVANGIRMTGMPAWQFRLNEEDLWNVVAFVKRLPDLSPGLYGKLEKQIEPSMALDDGPANAR